MGEDEKKIAVWKQRDQWSNKTNVVQQKKECCTTNTTKNKASTTNTTKKESNKTQKKIIDTLEENEELTEKQKLFCMYYINNFNAKLSAIKAGYSVETAGVMGYENLNKPHIQAQIKKLKEIKNQNFMLNADDIVERYMRIAFGNMTDFVDFGTENIEYINKSGEQKSYKKSTLYFKDGENVDGGLIDEISESKNGIKVKLKDSLKALEWLSRYFTMNPMDKHKIEYDNKKLELEQQKGGQQEIVELQEAWVKALQETT